MDLQKHYEEIIKNKVGEKERACIRKMLDEAYKFTNKIFESHMELATSVGFGIRADILRAMIAYSARRLAGTIGYECKYPNNTINNCSYILLVKDKLKIIFSLTETSADVGKTSIYRENILHPLMQNLFEPEEDSEERISGLLVTYGKSKSDCCDYARIGIPGDKGWVASIELEQISYVAVDNEDDDENMVALEESFVEKLKGACLDEKRIG